MRAYGPLQAARASWIDRSTLPFCVLSRRSPAMMPRNTRVLLCAALAASSMIALAAASRVPDWAPAHGVIPDSEQRDPNVCTPPGECPTAHGRVGIVARLLRGSRKLITFPTAPQQHQAPRAHCGCLQLSACLALGLLGTWPAWHLAPGLAHGACLQTMLRAAWTHIQCLHDIASCSGEGVALCLLFAGGRGCNDNDKGE